MVGLGVGVGHAADVVEHLVGLYLGHRPGVGEAAEEVGGDLVDALVGTLGTEDDGHQELECVGELQFGGHFGHLLAEVGQYSFVSLFSFHVVVGIIS